MKLGHQKILVIALCLAGPPIWADSLELRNGSHIIGTFAGGTQSEIDFQVDGSVQKYNRDDVASLSFDRDSASGETLPRASSRFDGKASEGRPQVPAYLTIPAGTQISVRTIDGIDSRKNHVGDRFQASLEEPLFVDGNQVVPKGADVFGRLTEAKKSGTFTGKSELQLELTEIVVNAQTVPVVTGEYGLKGSSRGASTAKRTIGGAALGSIIGAIAGGGKGAAIGAGAGAGAGAGSEIIFRGEQVKIPSETLLEFTLQHDVSIPAPRN